jgi:ATP-dependent Clp protease ATP-binding subunit ClpC
MPDKMARFTQRARLVLSLAQEEAEHFQHMSISPEHVLLGLLREPGGIGSHALRESRLDYDTARELVEQLRPPGERAAFAKIDLSNGVKRTLERSVDQAHRMGHHYVGTEHFVLALLTKDGSKEFAIMKQVLDGFNVPITSIQKKVLDILTNPASDVPGKAERAEIAAISAVNLNVHINANEIVDQIQAGLDEGQTLADLTLNDLISLVDEHLDDVSDDLVNTARLTVLVGIINRILNAPGD